MLGCSPLTLALFHRYIPKTIGDQYRKQAGAVADYMQTAGHIQSHAESIASIGGAAREEKILDGKFEATLGVSRELHWTTSKQSFLFNMAYVRGSGTWMPWCMG